MWLPDERVEVLVIVMPFLKQDCQYCQYFSNKIVSFDFSSRLIRRGPCLGRRMFLSKWSLEKLKKKETPPHCVVCTHTNSTSPNFLCPGAKIWPGRISEVSNLRFLQLTPNISPSGALHRGGKGEVKPKTTIYPNWICLAGWLASLDSLNWQPNWKPHSFYHLGTLCQLQAGQARGVREWSQYIKLMYDYQTHLRRLQKYKQHTCVSGLQIIIIEWN